MKPVFTFVLLSIVLLSSCKKDNLSEVYKTSGVAINGYDPVAYFTENMPVKGDSIHSFSWKNADWYFSSKENLEAFSSNPEKYAPQFGGYCAYGMFEGHKATTEPDTWTIVDGKLYLNYNMNVKGLWMKEREEKIRIANENWPEVKIQEF